MNLAQRLKQDGATNPILFYRPQDPWGCFSNFSSHSVWMVDPHTGKLVEYKTTEHRFQAMKARDPDEHEWVRTAKSPSLAKERGRVVDIIDGWDPEYRSIAYYVMLEALYAKAHQHPSVGATLFDSLHRHIYEDSPVDDIWGWRYRESHTGKNLLGRAWMDVRDTAFAEELI